MKNIFRILVFVVPFFICSSCFEIIEKVKLKTDGSGEYVVIFNASKSKTRINSLLKMESVNGKKVPKKAQVNKKIDDIAAHLKEVSGISNVSTSIDWEEFIVKLNFSFKNIENINAGLENLKAKKIIDAKVPTQIYTYKKDSKTLTKNNISILKSEYQKMKSADQEVFNNANYTMIVQFDDVIKSQNNAQYLMSGNKKAIKLEGTVLDFIYNKKSFQNKVTLN